MERFRKYQLPAFLERIVEQAVYERWLHRKAMAHVRRDRARGYESVKNEDYKIKIHRAVVESAGRDCYTNEELDWTLLSQYNNEESKKYGRIYKKKFALLPSVDHIDDGKGPANFKICAWRTNDAKNDLDYEDFLDLCSKVLRAANK